MRRMTQAEFAHLAELVRRRSGLLLTQDKSDLILRRLAPVAERFGFKTAVALLDEIEHPPEEIAQAVTEALTTNETSFFRDPAQFEHFRIRLLPPLLESRASQRRLRVWCAAAATGQEAYSVAMILDDTELARAGWKLDIIATDLSAETIARAKDGVYSPFEAERGLSERSLKQHFTQDGAQWRVNERLRRMVTFRVFNLLDDFGWLGEIDVIFCRNVLMYFEQRARTAVLRKLSETMAHDGALVLGALEGCMESSLAPAPGPRGFYIRPRSAALPAAGLAG
jgi:chemotaxis protein methyltransferase CheR